MGAFSGSMLIFGSVRDDSITIYPLDVQFNFVDFRKLVMEKNQPDGILDSFLVFGSCFFVFGRSLEKPFVKEVASLSILFLGRFME